MAVTRIINTRQSGDTKCFPGWGQSVCIGVITGALFARYDGDAFRMRRDHMADSVIRSRIDPKIKDEANRVLRSMGLNMSDAIRLF
jgi:hypothetical protein